MQYLLTQEEFEELANRAVNAKKQLKEIFLELCQRLADSELCHKPYNWKEGEPLVAYTCIKTRMKNGDTLGIYCDNCQLKKICPEINKRWSK